jgi:hypothetical protein
MPFFTIFDFHCNGYFYASDYAQGVGWCMPGISPDPFDTGRLTSTDAQWIVRCCCFRQQKPTEDSPLFFPFLPFSSLLFLVHSTQHAVHDCKQITRMSAIHQLLPVYRCVYTPPILAWGLLSFFIPSANVFKEKSGHNEKLPDK